MKILKTYSAYENEKFLHSFGFKGSKLTGVWQVYVCVTDGENYGVGVGVESVLWADGNVFARYGEDKANSLMYSVTKYALELIKGNTYEKPYDIIKDNFDKLYAYACEICDMKVSKTFVLNSLVAVDFACWNLWAKTNNVTDFEKIYKGDTKNYALANIPLITYNTPIEDVVKMASEGVCLFKIKIGSDPNGDGDREKMLEWDKGRILQIHNALKDIKTPYTTSGHALYYYDANGRYDSKERLTALVDYMQEIGVLDRTVTFEEPFPEEMEIYVGDLPVNFSADESVHSLEDAKKRIELGYKTLTLKPVAKTLSVSIEMAEFAKAHGVQCFPADLTVNPYMVEWNKNFASRLTALKGMKIGVVESNGAQNYVNWEKMKNYLDGGFIDSNIYDLTKGFYENFGGIFNEPSYYVEFIKKTNNLKKF